MCPAIATAAQTRHCSSRCECHDDPALPTTVTAPLAATPLTTEEDEEFPILERVWDNRRQGHEYVYNTIKPKHMDALGQEMSRAFQLVVREAESEENHVDQQEQQQQRERSRNFPQNLIASIHFIDSAFEEQQIAWNEGRKTIKGKTVTVAASEEEGSGGGSTLLLFRQTMITAQNLNCLLRMCDAWTTPPRRPTAYRGRVRCAARILLNSVSLIPSVWKVKMITDGKPFLYSLVRTLSQALQDDIELASTTNSTNRKAPPLHTDAKDTCSCDESGVTLALALNTAKSKPHVLMQILNEYDWATILNHQPTGVSLEDNSTNLFLCESLHRYARYALQYNNGHDDNAKSLLHKIGNATSLLTRVLKQLNKTLAVKSENLKKTESELLSPSILTLQAILCSLTKLPTSDRQIEKLVRKLRTFKGSLSSHMTSAFTFDPTSAIPILLHHVMPILSKWDKLKKETDTDRWNRFVHTYQLKFDANSRSNNQEKSIATTGQLQQPQVAAATHNDDWKKEVKKIRNTYTEVADRIKQQQLELREKAQAKENNSDTSAEDLSSADVPMTCFKSTNSGLVNTWVEMCANCFVTESELQKRQSAVCHETTASADAAAAAASPNVDLSSCFLRECSRCRQIKYCGPACQKQHWKKAHKHQCMPTKTTAVATKPSKSQA